MTRRVVVLVAALLAAAPAAHAAAPEITAPEAIVVDALTGDVLYEKDADERHAIASTTKLMTALLTLEHGDLDEMVTAPRYSAAVGESVLPLVRGERMRVLDLLRGLLVVSANDAAVALAEHVAGSVPSFVRMMNRRARDLGLDDTHYANPVGLDDPGNYSTARDLATLTRELRTHKVFREIVDSEAVTLESGARTRTLDNRNNLLDEYPWVNGVKTGYTREAGNVLVASGKKKRGVRLISVVIGAATESVRDAESVELLEYGFGKYRRARAVVEDHRYGSIPVANRPGAELPVVAARTVRRFIRRDEEFERIIDLPAEVEGPIGYGDPIGQVVIEYRGETIDTVTLRAALEIPAASTARQLQDVVTRPWILIALGGILIAVALATHRRSPRTEPA